MFGATFGIRDKSLFHNKFNDLSNTASDLVRISAHWVSGYPKKMLDNEKHRNNTNLGIDNSRKMVVSSLKFLLSLNSTLKNVIEEMSSAKKINVHIVKLFEE